MSSVILRCPNCGTTRSSLGECEACHESQVRYYCVNHTPSLWLDAKNCSACGARFGETPPPPPKAPAPALTRRPPAAAPPQRPKAASSPRSMPARRPVSGGVPADGHLRAPPGEIEKTPDARRVRGERDVHVSGWGKMLRAASSARRSPLETKADSGFDPGALPGRRPGGCLLRILLMIVFLFLALASGVFVFGASILQMFMRF